MTIRTIATCVLVVVGSLRICARAEGAQSAEINPFAATDLQVDARMARIQQEVNRLQAAGLFAAANLMSGQLSHFQLERSGIQGSQISGPELDAIGMYTANGDTPIVEIRPTDRPVVLALGAYELVHWTLQVFPGANLQKVIVSGYDGAERPSNVPAGVPVEVTSYTAGSGNYFYFYSKGQGSFVDAVKTIRDNRAGPHVQNRQARDNQNVAIRQDFGELTLRIVNAALFGDLLHMELGLFRLDFVAARLLACGFGGDIRKVFLIARHEGGAKLLGHLATAQLRAVFFGQFIERALAQFF